MHAAVVELDALPDAVRAAAEDHDLAALASARPRTPLRRSNTGRPSTWRTRPRRCRRACTPGARRTRGGAGARLLPRCRAAVARRPSEKPLRLSARMRVASSASSPRALHACSLPRTRSSICARNQGSMCVSRLHFLERPAGAECIARRNSMRSGPGMRSSCASTRGRFIVSSGSVSCGSRPSEPVSRPRSAFCSDSWNVRPIAITSPTDFICVVRRRSAPGNFSNVKRGILVTT